MRQDYKKTFVFFLNFDSYYRSQIEGDAEITNFSLGWERIHFQIKIPGGTTGWKIN